MDYIGRNIEDLPLFCLLDKDALLRIYILCIDKSEQTKIEWMVAFAARQSHLVRNYIKTRPLACRTK